MIRQCLRYVSQDGVRWAMAQAEINAIDQHFEHKLLMILGLHADRDGFACPSHEYLAELARTDVRCIRRTLQRFRQMRIVMVERNARKQRNSNSYRLMSWIELSSPDGEYQLKVADSKADFKPDFGSGLQDSGVRKSADCRTPESVGAGLLSPAEDSIEDSKEVRANSRAFANEKIVEDDRPPSAGTHSPVACSDPAVQRGKSDRAWRVKVWNLANLVRIERPLTRGEAIALQNALKHPALAKDDDAWRRYVRWVRDDTFLGGKAADGYKADLRQAVAAHHIDRWAAQDQGPPAPATSSAPMILTTPVLPGMVIPTGGMTAKELRKDPLLLAGLVANGLPLSKLDPEAREILKAASEAPGGIYGDVGRRNGNGPPDRAREMADA